MAFPISRGSKNSIAKWVVEQLPASHTFVDLFAGGCAVTHAAMISGKYKNIIINDIDARMPKFFIDCINGKYTTQNQTEWISREAFFERIDEAYVALCWSFGNDCETYIYGRDIEAFKKALHYACFFSDTSLFRELGINVPQVQEDDPYERYLQYKREFSSWRIDYETLERLQALESLSRLQSLQSLQSLQNLQSYGLDYQDINIPEGVVVYCDIPYHSSNGGHYKKFDHDRFYKWAEEQDSIFISEYWMPDNFIPYAHTEKSVLSAAITNAITADEIIYTNERTFRKLNQETKVLVAMNFCEQMSLF